MPTVELEWLACNLRTGAIAEELRSLRPTQPLGRRLGQAVSTSFELDLTGAPVEWASASDPGRILLVAVDRSTGLPVWSGLALVRAGGAVRWGVVVCWGMLGTALDCSSRGRISSLRRDTLASSIPSPIACSLSARQRAGPSGGYNLGPP